jgi:small GTP-binding protein
MKFTTGIPKLDEMLDGGIPYDSTVLILADPLVDVATFAQQMLSHRLEDGDKCIYLSTNKLPKDIESNMYKHGFNKNGIIFIDCLSYTLGKKSDAKYVLKQLITDGRTTWDEVRKLWEQVLFDESGRKFALWDCLQTFMGFANEIPDFIKKCRAINEDTKTTSVFILTSWGYDKKEIEKIKKAFDVVIETATVAKKLLYLNYYKVDDKPAIPFQVTLTGVTLYVPKILITGPYNAGKSTLVKQLSETAVSVDRLGTTIALDHGYVEKKGFACNLFGTPGQERFDWIMEVLSRDVWGVILIVDSTQPETFPRALEMLEKVKEEYIPFIVFANKQDMKGALPPEEIKKRLGVPIVIGGSALKGENTEKALLTLFDEILKRKVFEV